MRRFPLLTDIVTVAWKALLIKATNARAHSELRNGKLQSVAWWTMQQLYREEDAGLLSKMALFSNFYEIEDVLPAPAVGWMTSPYHQYIILLSSRV